MLREGGTVEANGVQFAVLTAGPQDGPLALCLHGFPDTAWSFRHLAGPLGDAGWRVVAPFMRGYAPSSLPEDGCYQTGALVADATALHEALDGDDRAVIIGHDWGAPAAYGAATHAPDRWHRVIAMAVPPSPALASGFIRYDQLRRSWYMFFFQLPLAEAIVPAGDFDFIARLWADWSPGYDASEELAHVRAALGDPAHLTAALGYYRATFDPARHSPAFADEQAATQAVPSQPTLYLHGRDDGCIGVELAEATRGTLSEGSEVVIVDGAGHFLQLERPDEVAQLVLDFLGDG